MSPEELKNQFRIDVEDPELPGSGDDSDSLWLDTEIYRFMDLAQREFVRLTDYLTDATSPSVSELVVTAGEAYIDLDISVLKIRRARLLTAGSMVIAITLQDYEAGVLTHDYGISPGSSSWEDTTGTPRFLITDMEYLKARLVPIPVTDDILSMAVFRAPDEIVDINSTLEVNDVLHQYTMLLWMKKLAYSKQDVETVDMTLVDRFEGEFLEYTTKLKHTMKRTSRGSAGIIRYGGL